VFPWWEGGTDEAQSRCSFNNLMRSLQIYHRAGSESCRSYKPGTDGNCPPRTDGDPQPTPARGTTITLRPLPSLSPPPRSPAVQVMAQGFKLSRVPGRRAGPRSLSRRARLWPRPPRPGPGPGGPGLTVLRRVRVGPGDSDSEPPGLRELADSERPGPEIPQAQCRTA
jgi:hypothetical protein